MAPQAAIGVVGNPALCPAFRVRRGSGREYGFAASRARRATRPNSRANFGAMWAWRRHQQPASVLGHHSPSASPRALPPRCRSAGELGNPLGSRAGTPTGSTDTAGERGARRKAAPTRARAMTRPTQRAAAFTSAGVSQPLDRGRSSTTSVSIVSQQYVGEGIWRRVRSDGASGSFADPMINGEVAPRAVVSQFHTSNYVNEPNLLCLRCSCHARDDRVFA